MIEAVMIAIHGQLLQPHIEVEYLIPYSTIMELYEMQDSVEPVMPDSEDDRHVRAKIKEMIAFFETELNRKKIERALSVPWRESPPIPVNEHVSVKVVHCIEQAQYGEAFDPIETELILCTMRHNAPLLTDQLDLLDRLIQFEIPIRMYDIDDYEFALEQDVQADDIEIP